MEFVACSRCGAEVLDGAITCSACGFLLSQDGVEAAHLPVADGEVAAKEVPGLPPFFAVSLTKLAVMSFFTFGLYDIYWFYRNWQRVRVREQVNIRPSLRAIAFGFFFCYPCFKRIKKFGLEHGVPSNIPFVMLSIGWTVMILTSQLPRPVGLVSLFSFVFLLPVQSYVNRINSAIVPTHAPNSRLTPGNWVGIAIGGVLLLLVFLSLILSTHPESGISPT